MTFSNWMMLSLFVGMALMLISAYGLSTPIARLTNSLVFDRRFLKVTFVLGVILWAIPVIMAGIVRFT